MTILWFWFEGQGKGRSRSPFDFAHGKLSGDGNKRCKNNDNGNDEIQGSFASLRITTKASKARAKGDRNGKRF
jgi:hypothetical protein